MSARTLPTTRMGATVALSLVFALLGVTPTLAQDGGDVDTSAGAEEIVEPSDVQKALEEAEGNRPGAHDELPSSLTGDTAMEAFETAWQSDYSALEAAMIVTATHRDYMPPIPEDSGSGERVVYSLSQQRLWMVAEDGLLIDSYLVSGRDWMPNVGTFRVWSKAARTHGYDPDYTMNWMVRFAVGSHGGNIGFHELPLYRGRAVQTLEELGQPLSGGCVRQDGYHARMMYAWAKVGTTVEVIP